MQTQKIGKRDQKKIEAEVAALSKAVGSVLDIAQETEIEYVTGKLRADPQLLHRISSLIKNDALRAVLDGSLQTAGAASPTGGGSPAGGKTLSLRRSAKKWKHLLQQPAIITAILKRLGGTNCVDDSGPCLRNYHRPAN